MLNKLNDYLNQNKGKLNSLEERLNKVKKEKCLSKKEMIRSERAQIIIQNVAKLTQEKIKIHIEDIVGLAINSLFGDIYNFKLDFVVKRNKTECEIYLEDKDGNKLKPMQDNGGGVVDLISFALRIALWNLQFGKKNNTILLDETFKHLSKDKIEQCALLLKELSKKLDIQFVLITHIDEFSEVADKVFKVKIKNGKSEVEN
jgi:DNA repair exonuclease SbcCD ATPase subunit